MLVLKRHPGEAIAITDRDGNRTLLVLEQIDEITRRCELTVHMPDGELATDEFGREDRTRLPGQTEMLVCGVNPTVVRLGFEAPLTTRISRIPTTHMPEAEYSPATGTRVGRRGRQALEAAGVDPAQVPAIVETVDA